VWCIKSLQILSRKKWWSIMSSADLLPARQSGFRPDHRGRGTCRAGTVNSVPLLKLGRKIVYFPSHFWWPDVQEMHQIAQIWFAHIFSNKFSEGNISGPPNWGVAPWGGAKPPSQIQLPRRAPTVPLFQSFRSRCQITQHKLLYTVLCVLSDILLAIDLGELAALILLDLTVAIDR